MRIFAHTVVGVDADLSRLEPWIRHYRRLGIAPEHFLFVLHSRTTGNPKLEEARRLVQTEAPGCQLLEWLGPFDTPTKHLHSCWIKQLHARKEDWVVVADADELQAHDGDDLRGAVERAARRGRVALVGEFSDRMTNDFGCAEIPRGADPHAIFPLATKLTRFVGRGAYTKVLAHAMSVLPDEGGNHRIRRFAGLPTRPFEDLGDAVTHFKWTPDIESRLAQRIADLRRGGLEWASESARFARFFQLPAGAARRRAYQRARIRYFTWSGVQTVKAAILRFLRSFAHPGIDPEAARWLAARFHRRDALTFAYGTSLFPLLVPLSRSVNAVEHVPLRQVAATSAYPTASTIWQALDPNGAYCRSVKQTGKAFDLVAVNGRDRANCLREAAASVAVDGVIVLCDSHRPRYEGAIQDLTARGFKLLRFGGHRRGRREQTTIFSR